MTKNKKKLRRVERRYSVTKSAQTLVLAGILLAGGVSGAMAAEGPWKAGPNWGDLTLNADATTTAPTATSVDGLWRDGHSLPNLGNLNIANKSFTVAHDTVVGNGSVSVGDGGSLIINANTMQISQGSLTLESGATLTMMGGTLNVDNDITAKGTLTSTLSAGNLWADNIDWGNNAFVTSGTFVVGADNVTAKNLDVTGAATIHADSVTATDAKSVFNSTAASAIGTGTFADLDVYNTATLTFEGNLTANNVSLGNTGNADGKLTVEGNLNAKKVIIDANTAAANGVLTLGANPADTTLSVTGDHKTADITITKGTLALAGRAEVLDADGEVTTGAVGQKLTGDIILNAGSATDAVVSTNAGTHTVEGDIVVNASKFGTVTAASNLNVNNIKLNGTSGSVATLVLNGAGTVKTDALNMTYGAATLTNGTLQTGHDKMTLDANSTLTVTSGTLQLTGGDYNHVMDKQSAGLVMDGGTLRVDGQLTLTANTVGNTQAINTGSASNVDTVKGSIVANTLRTDSTNASGVTITAGSVQLMGYGVAAATDLFTQGNATNKISVTANTGTLVLGATEKHNLGKEKTYSGTVKEVDLGTAGNLQFGHGNFTVTTLTDATNTTTQTDSGVLIFNDDTDWSNKDNRNTIQLGAAANTAFEASAVTLGAGHFDVNGTGGLKMVEKGIATIDVADGLSGSLNKLTLADDGSDGNTSTLVTGSNFDGTYTIGAVDVTSTTDAAVITIADGTAGSKVIFDSLKLDAGNAGTSERIVVGGGTNAVTLQINAIDSGTAVTNNKFKVDDNGTLLFGTNVTLGNGSFTVKDSANADKAFDLSTVAGGTLGSTSVITVAGGTAYTLGSTDGANSTLLNLSAKKFIFTTADELNIGGAQNDATLSLLGDGTTAADSLTNATKINIGSGTKEGTLALGGMNSDGTKAGGGKYSGEINIGNTTKAGTLEFLGGNFTLDKVKLNSAAGVASVNLTSGTGVLNITMDGATTKGLVLNGNSAATNILNVGTGTVAGVNTEYEIVGGVTVTKGTVNFGNVNKASNVNILKNTITLNGSAVGNALIEIDGGNNYIDGISIADTKQGTLSLNAGSLTVGSALNMSKGALNLSTGTLAVTGALTSGAVSFGTTAGAGATKIVANSTTTIAADSWTVRNATDTANAAIDLSTAANAGTVNLAMGTGGITAAAFKMDNTTVNLLGAGGKITLTDATVDGGFMVVGGGTNTTTLKVGRAFANANTPAVKSDWSTDKMKIDNATVNVANGSLAIKTLSTTANGSAITVGDFGPEPEDDTTGALRVETATFVAGDNNLTVDLGYAQFGSVDAALGTKVASAMQATNSLSALAVTGNQLDLSNVTATIGNQRQDTARVTPNDKSVEFGDDSLTYIDYNTVGKTEAAIKTGGNVFVDTGAKLYLAKDGGLRAGDTIKILTTTATDGVKGMWEAANVGTTSRLINLSLTVDEDHKNVTGHTSLADPAKTMPGISSSMAGLIRDMANQVGVDVDSKNAGIKFVSRAADRTFLTNDNQAASTIEGAAQLAVVGAAPAMTLSAVQAGTSTVTTRTSFASPLMDSSKAVALHKDTDGTLSVDSGLNAGNGMKNGFGLWIMPLYQSNSAWGMKADGFKGGYKSDLGGVALGADYTFNDMFRLGLAFNIGGGYAESNGDFNKTENSFNFWGINAYGGWTMNNFGITADVGYTGNYNKLQQELPSGMGMSDIKSDVNSSAWTAGLRGEYKFATEALDIIPHVGVRYTGLTTDEYKAKSGGDTVFKVDQSFQSIWTFPIGVTLAKEIETGSGWIIRPQVDLGITPATGDVKAKSKVRIPGVDSQAEMKMQVVDYMSYDGGVGLEMKKDNVSFGINYNIQASEHRTGHGVFGTFRYEF